MARPRGVAGCRPDHPPEPAGDVSALHAPPLDDQQENCLVDEDTRAEGTCGQKMVCWEVQGADSCRICLKPGLRWFEPPNLSNVVHHGSATLLVQHRAYRDLPYTRSIDLIMRLTSRVMPLDHPCELSVAGGDV